jgi:opacity protein-like surface antigen
MGEKMKKYLSALASAGLILTAFSSSNVQAQNGPAFFENVFVGGGFVYRWADGDLDKDPLTIKPFKGVHKYWKRELPAFASGLDFDGAGGNLHVGKNWRENNTLWGVVLNVDILDDSDNASFNAHWKKETCYKCYWADFDENIEVDAKWQGRVGLKYGRIFGNFAPYITGGVAVARVKASADGTLTSFKDYDCYDDPAYMSASYASGNSKSTNMWGPFVGVGGHWAFGKDGKLALSVEAIHEWLGDRGFRGVELPYYYNEKSVQTFELDDLEATKVTVKLSYAFGGASSPVAMK